MPQKTLAELKANFSAELYKIFIDTYSSETEDKFFTRMQKILEDNQSTPSLKTLADNKQYEGLKKAYSDLISGNAIGTEKSAFWRDLYKQFAQQAKDHRTNEIKPIRTIKKF